MERREDRKRLCKTTSLGWTRISRSWRYIIYRQAGLNATQEDQVVTWTAGQYGREVIVKALRKLEKVHKDRGGKTFLAEEGAASEAADVFATMEQESDHEIENYVYVNEGDMDQIFNEEDLHEALAT